MFVVDTNVLVYAADESAPEHGRCRALIEGWRRRQGAWYLTWGICYEFLRMFMREHGIRRICTRDTDFHRFPFLEPIDPLTAEP